MPNSTQVPPTQAETNAASKIRGAFKGQVKIQYKNRLGNNLAKLKIKNTNIIPFAQQITTGLTPVQAIKLANGHKKVIQFFNNKGLLKDGLIQKRLYEREANEIIQEFDEMLKEHNLILQGSSLNSIKNMIWGIRPLREVKKPQLANAENHNNAAVGPNGAAGGPSGAADGQHTEPQAPPGSKNARASRRVSQTKSSRASTVVLSKQMKKGLNDKLKKEIEKLKKKIVKLNKELTKIKASKMQPLRKRALTQKAKRDLESAKHMKSYYMGVKKTIK